MEVRSTAREHGEKGRSEERVMGSRKDQRTSAYSGDNIDAGEEPTEGKRGEERVGMPRYSGRGDNRTKGGTHGAREARNLAYNRSDKGPN